MRAGRRGRRAARRTALDDRRRSTPSTGPWRRRSRRCRWPLRLADDIDVGRGSTIVRPQNQPTVASSFEALLCWMSEQPLEPQRRYIVKHTTRTALVGGIDVRYRIDVETLHRDESAATLELNDLGRVQLELSAPLVFDSYRRNRTTGSLIVIDEATNETVARRGDPRHRGRRRGRGPKTERSPNVRWQGTRMTRERRWSSLGHPGATLWFTGLPGAGKSTIAAAVEERLIGAGQSAFLLDGDNLRHGLNGDLGFDEHARARERPPHRARRAAAGRVGHDRARQPRQPLRAPTARRRRRCTRRRARVPRGLRRRAARAVRETRPEGPVRARARGRAERADGRRRAVRAAGRTRPRARHARRNRRARRRARARAARAARAALRSRLIEGAEAPTARSAAARWRSRRPRTGPS